MGSLHFRVRTTFLQREFDIYTHDFSPLNNIGYMLNENNIFSEEKYEVVELKRVLFEKLSRGAQRQVLSRYTVIFMSSPWCLNLSSICAN